LSGIGRHGIGSYPERSGPSQDCLISNIQQRTASRFSTHSALAGQPERPAIPFLASRWPLVADPGSPGPWECPACIGTMLVEGVRFFSLARSGWDKTPTQQHLDSRVRFPCTFRLRQDFLRYLVSLCTLDDWKMFLALRSPYTFFGRQVPHTYLCHILMAGCPKQIKIPSKPKWLTSETKKCHVLWCHALVHRGYRSASQGMSCRVAFFVHVALCIFFPAMGACGEHTPVSQGPAGQA
jgi:hypothetical protein